MKKFMSTICAVIMIFSLVFVSSADYRGAVDGIEMKAGINPVVRVNNESRFNYVIYARDMKGMTNGDFTVYYDSDVLELVSVKATGDFDSSFCNDVGGEIYFAYMFKTANEYDALKMFVLTFDCTVQGVYPSLEVTNLAGTFIKSVADVVVVEGVDYDSDESFDDGNDNMIINDKGDVNLDGNITAADARYALRISAMLDEVDDDTYKRADMNDDGTVTASDARKILRISAKLE